MPAPFRCRSRPGLNREADGAALRRAAGGEKSRQLTSGPGLAPAFLCGRARAIRPRRPPKTREKQGCFIGSSYQQMVL